MQRLLPCFSAQTESLQVLHDLATDEPGQTPSTTPVHAWENSKLTLGFSGGGFLLPYHLGVYQSLALMGIANPSMPMAGASAGSLVVASIKCGLTLQQQMESFLEAAHECRQNGVAGRLRKVLKAQLNKYLPHDAAARCSDGTCWLSVTQLLPRPANKLYGAFASRQQLIKALLASCHLPRLSDGGLFTSYKSFHKRCFDGGFSNLVPVPPAPPPTATFTAFTTTAAVTATGSSTAAAAAASMPSPAHPGHGTAAGAAAAAEEEARLSGVQQLPTAPATALLRQDSTKGISTQLGSRRSTNSKRNSRRVGSSHAHIASAAKHRTSNGTAAISSSSGGSSCPWTALAASCSVAGSGAYVASEGWFAVRVCVLPSRHLGQFPAMFRAPTADEVSIALDKFQDWPHDLDVTTKLALYPQEEDFLYDLFDCGAADGVSWARLQGFPEAVLQKAAAAGCEGVGGDSSSSIPAELRVVRNLQQQQQAMAMDVQQQAAEAAVAAAAAGVREAAEGVWSAARV